MRIAVVSDIHYAGPEEQSRVDHELRVIQNPLMRGAVRFYRNRIWLKNPLGQNHLLDQFLEKVPEVDLAVANGDFSCDTGFVGVSDPAARQSAEICLRRLREKFGDRLLATLGDHELGKSSLGSGSGGIRFSSWNVCRETLGLEPSWRRDLENWVLIGVPSSLLAFPVYGLESLPEESESWQRTRDAEISKIRSLFSTVKGRQKILLFCHDPTALPFLWDLEQVREKAALIDRTIIGHLHTNLVLWKSRFLAGMPRVTFLGKTARRLTTALNQAALWRPFRVTLCPALSGIELLKDGGFLVLDVEAGAKKNSMVNRIPIER
jgi:hypothetical protein